MRFAHQSPTSIIKKALASMVVILVYLNGCRIFVDIMTGDILNSSKFRLQFPLKFIGRAVYPVGGEGNWVDRYFSPLQNLKIWCKIHPFLNAKLFYNQGQSVRTSVTDSFFR